MSRHAFWIAFFTAFLTTAACAASFVERTAPLSSPWHMQIISSIGGRVVDAINLDENAYTDERTCAAALRADKTIAKLMPVASRNIADEYGPTAKIVVACVLDVN
jgi:hypothetical protein